MKLKCLRRLSSHVLLAFFICWRVDRQRRLVLSGATKIESLTSWPAHDRIPYAVLAIWNRLKSIISPPPHRSHMLHEPGWLKVLKLLAKLGYVTLKCRLLRLKGIILLHRLRKADRKTRVLLDKNRALVILKCETLLKYNGGPVLVNELLQCGNGIQCHGVVSSYPANADVLLPGQGRAVGVEVVGFMPVSSDVLLALSSLVSS